MVSPIVEKSRDTAIINLKMMLLKVDNTNLKAEVKLLIKKINNLDISDAELCKKCGKKHSASDESDTCLVCFICNNYHHTKECNYKCNQCDKIGDHIERWCSKTCKWCSLTHPSEYCSKNPKIEKTKTKNKIPLTKYCKICGSDSHKTGGCPQKYKDYVKQPDPSQDQEKCNFCGFVHQVMLCPQIAIW